MSFLRRPYCLFAEPSLMLPVTSSMLPMLPFGRALRGNTGGKLCAPGGASLLVWAGAPSDMLPGTSLMLPIPDCCELAGGDTGGSVVVPAGRP